MQALHGRHVLTEDDLSEIDRHLLDFLVEDRITPAYAQARIVDEGIRNTITSQHCQQRLTRLVEHDYVRKPYGLGLYELVNDPREDR